MKIDARHTISAAAKVAAITAVIVLTSGQANAGPTSNVNVVNTPNVNVVNIPTVQNIQGFASQNAFLVVTAGALPPSAAASLDDGTTGGVYVVPSGQTLMITSIDITPTTAGIGTNRVGIESETVSAQR